MADDRVAVVTGAASGIGRAVALRLAGEGNRVAAADLNLDGAKETAGMAEGITPFGVDITSDEAVASLRDDVVARLGAPAVLANCAGWDEFKMFAETDRDFWERVVKINYLGAVAVTHAFLEPMSQLGDARVVSIASDAGRVGSLGETVYAGAKGGIIAFTKSLAREVARHGISANVVCPGPTDTPLFETFPEKVQGALVKAIPMRRTAEPDDVAHAVAFFASPRSGYITGQVLSVSGGLTMNG